MRCVKPPFPFTGMIRLEVIGIHTFDSDMIKPKPAAYLSILRLVRTLRMSSAGTEQSATACEYVCFWHRADIDFDAEHVRFAPESRHSSLLSAHKQTVTASGMPWGLRVVRYGD